MALIGVIASSALVVVFPGNQLIAAATTCATANTLNAGAFGQSNFEIDAPVADSTKLGAHAGANLTNDGGSPCIDWSRFAAGAGTGTEADKTSGVIVKHDLPSGTGDDSFTQGTSENATDPTVGFGSIPPNKSDLQTFWVYKETNTTGKFLDLAWSRINSPSGTVTMDFELNQVACNNNAATCSNNAPKGTLYDIPLRTNGDKLIVYNLASGGTVPTLSIYTWSGNSTSGTWGTGTLISGGSNPEALGSINFRRHLRVIWIRLSQEPVVQHFHRRIEGLHSPAARHTHELHHADDECNAIGDHRLTHQRHGDPDRGNQPYRHGHFQGLRSKHEPELHHCTGLHIERRLRKQRQHDLRTSELHPDAGWHVLLDSGL
ncbi:MAG: hypothetical protein E6I67_08865 [Chloroflexi bacterium]|nr:MAG: hypothetical protein E6I67_08865 [Chloroflexota bacterium]